MKRLFKSSWLMWFVTMCFMLFQFLLQLSFGVMIKPLTSSFHLTSIGVGMLVGSFYVAYMFLQIPAGMLVDRYGPRRLLTAGAMICALGCFLFAISNRFELAFLGRVLMGVGASFPFVGTLYVIEHRFPAKRFSLMVGIVETFGMLGVLVVNVLSARLLQHLEWRNLLYAATMIAVFLALASYCVIRDGSAEAEALTGTEAYSSPEKDFFRGMRWIMRQPVLWWNGIYSGLIFSGVSVFAGLWMPPYLTLRQSASPTLITFENSLVFVGLAVGAPLMGVLYPKLKSPGKLLTCTALIAASICCWLVLNPPSSAWLGSAVFFLLGLFLSCYILNFTLANSWVPRHMRSTCIGFTNALCVLASPLLQPLVGATLHYLAKLHGGGSQHTVSEYQWALSIVPLGLVVAAFVAWMLTTHHTDVKKHV